MYKLHMVSATVGGTFSNSLLFSRHDMVFVMVFALGECSKSGHEIRKGRMELMHASLKHACY